MKEDLELAGELETFLNDDLLQIFAADQDLTVEWMIEPAGDLSRAVITLAGTVMPVAEHVDAQTALDNATVQAIELLTRRNRELEPVLAFA